MTTGVSEVNLAAMKEAFSLFDKDGDGLIMGCELTWCIRSLGLTISDADMDRLLADKYDHTLSEDDFIRMMVPEMQNRRPQEEVMGAFKMFDRDCSGRASADEVRQVLMFLRSVLSEQDINRLIEVADPGRTGSIDYMAFVKKICNTHVSLNP